MAEYVEHICKHRAKHFVCEFCNEHYSDEPCEPNDCEWMKAIDDEPAADVAPVRHGRWVFDGSDFADIWKCSACGDDWYFEYDPRDAETLVNYCPNCGAKMDLEEDNT